MEMLHGASLQAGMHHQLGCEIQVVAQICLLETAWKSAENQHLARLPLAFAKSCEKHKADCSLHVELCSVAVRSVRSKQAASAQPL